MGLNPNEFTLILAKMLCLVSWWVCYEVSLLDKLSNFWNLSKDIQLRNT